MITVRHGFLSWLKVAGLNSFDCGKRNVAYVVMIIDAGFELDLFPDRTGQIEIFANGVDKVFHYSYVLLK
jgi:hypothetical protein